MKVTPTELSGVYVITPDVHRDERGYLFESFNTNSFKSQNISVEFVQDNQVFSKEGVIRGLHYQLNYPQGKLVSTSHGEIYDVAVDIRVGSPTFGKYFGLNLSDENFKMLFVPQGFAHGYQVLSKTAKVQYKCTRVYHPEDENGIVWNDKDVDVVWPINNPVLSEKDKNLPTLKTIDRRHLPRF
jgi:dTDP-4-dehydrorhamnose 3,5-epimerase